MELTKKQEKKLEKVFNNPKQLRKWIDDVYQDMIKACEVKTENMILQYLTNFVHSYLQHIREQILN